MHNNIIRGSMKNKFLFVIAMLSVLTMTGCKDEQTKMETLSAPQEVVVQSDGERSLIIFDEVNNADYYDIYINDICITVKGNGSGTVQFDASKIITLPQKYVVKVKAVGDNHFDSAFTEAFEYDYTSKLDAPIATVDGTTLNWNRVDNADLYKVEISKNNQTIEISPTFSNNSFNFSNIIKNAGIGQYSFKVLAISESGNYIESIYSNAVTYTYTQTLTTPYNLTATYDKSTDEIYLNFVADENVSEFSVNINGSNYSIASNRLTHFNDYNNVYVLKLKSFAEEQGIVVNNSTLINVSVKSNSAGNSYFVGSDYSQSITCQISDVLKTPSFEVLTTSKSCFISISYTNSQYLSGFAIYVNDKNYLSVTKDISEIELPLTDEIKKAGIRIQSISNNNNVYSSSLSDAQYQSNKKKQ